MCYVQLDMMINEARNEGVPFSKRISIIIV